MAREPQPFGRALADVVAGPGAGRAVAAAYPAAAALSQPPGAPDHPSAWRAFTNGIARPKQSAAHGQNDPAAWGYAARSLTAGKIWRTTPPSPADTSVVNSRFNARIRLRLPLNLFQSIQTHLCLGHCITRGLGLRRQAKILRLRGVVLFGGDRSRSSGNDASPIWPPQRLKPL